MGMLMMQIAQFKREYAVRVQVVGIENWPEELPLLDADGRLSDAVQAGKLQELIEFSTAPWPRDPAAQATLAERAREAIATNQFDAVLLVYPDFSRRLRERIGLDSDGPTSGDANEVVDGDADGPIEQEKAIGLDSELQTKKTGGHPASGLQTVTNLARDRSQTAQSRLAQVLDQWREQWVAQQLARAGLSPKLVEPLQVQSTDTAPPKVRRAMLWSKILPFVMLVWALTGAFYPAIDLCAGEKERGTLETLLSSPARRQEIVWGKLATITVFSIGTALLNLLSMHVTAGIVVKQMVAHGAPGAAEALGPMPFHALGWLVVLLVPMAAFFSALALAVAALARSTKEGQYYLMPLLLVTLPLVALPMIPDLELNLGTSLVPVAGAVFLVRSLIEGRFAEAAMHFLPVLGVTALCCWTSIRWAIRQFESEAVMFRESERWNLRLWVHHLWRDRGDTATPAEAVLCGVIILVFMFFAQMLAGPSINSWTAIVQSTVAVQLGVILAPALLMAIMLTRSLRRALRIEVPRAEHLVLSLLLGVALHPLYRILGTQIAKVFPIGEDTQLALQFFERTVMEQPLWACAGLLALLPAVCEELTFRGFIFGGLAAHGRTARAIAVSALLFGFTHNLLPQSIAAVCMGLVLGVVAWRTGSVLCTMIVHGLNNLLTVTIAWYSTRDAEIPMALQWALRPGEQGWEYQPAWVLGAAALAALVAIRLYSSRRPAPPLSQPATGAEVS
ncbi:MAG: CPBP family intramembrane metalloprotease [Planctomycetota bacterium]|nr:MAG: CPBP family intramembrane metalloprotease [Planctomycetota bacterium]